jgi:hypothetical protein
MRFPMSLVHVPTRFADRLDDLINSKEVREIYGGISRTKHHRGMKDGTYSRPIEFGPYTHRWRIRTALEDIERAEAKGQKQPPEAAE